MGNKIVNSFLDTIDNEETLRSYRFDLISILGDLENVSYDTILNYKVSDLEKYLKTIKAQGSSFSVAKRRVACLKSFFNYVENKYAFKNPLKNFKHTFIRDMFKEVANEEIIEVDKLDSLIEFVSLSEKKLTRKFKNYRLKVVYSLITRLGMKRSQICNLLVNDFDNDNMRISVMEGEHRILKNISEELALLIEGYIRVVDELLGTLSGTDFLIQSGKKGFNLKPIDGSSIYRMIIDFFKKNDVVINFDLEALRSNYYVDLIRGKKTENLILSKFDYEKINLFINDL